MSIPVRVTIRNDKEKLTKFGTTDALPTFPGHPIKVVCETKKSSDGKHDIPEGHIYVNDVDMRCYPRTDQWTDVGEGYEAQLKVGYEMQNSHSWFDKIPEDPEPPGFFKRLFGKKVEPVVRCKSCKNYDRNTGVKDMTEETGTYCNKEGGDPWRQDSADWIAQQIQAPTLDKSKLGYCYEKEMIVQSDYPKCPEFQKR